jgi:hypothetical protein
MYIHAKPIDELTDDEINNRIWKFEVGNRYIGDDIYLVGYSFASFEEAEKCAIEGFREEYKQFTRPHNGKIKANFVYILDHGHKIRDVKPYLVKS